MVTPEMLALLEGTRAVLARWGTSTEICLAGLFHSVYGAEGGEACERRSLFTNVADARPCTINDLFEKRHVPVAEATLRALLEMEAANFVEGPLERINYPDALLARLKVLWDDVRPFVTAQAYGEVRGRLRALDERRAASSQS